MKSEVGDHTTLLRALQDIRAAGYLADIKTPTVKTMTNLADEAICVYLGLRFDGGL